MIFFCFFIYLFLDCGILFVSVLLEVADKQNGERLSHEVILVNLCKFRHVVAQQKYVKPAGRIVTCWD